MARITSGQGFGDSVRKRVKQAPLPPNFKKNLLRVFRRRKQALLNSIENDRVSRELRNPSLDKPALFGFLGFHVGTDPVGELLKWLDVFITADVKDRNLLIRMPSISDLREHSSDTLDWTEYSWMELIEKQQFSYQFYLRKAGLANSNSTLGIQVDNKVRKQFYKRREYLSKHFERFEQDMKEKLERALTRAS